MLPVVVLFSHLKLAKEKDRLNNQSKKKLYDKG